MKPFLSHTSSEPRLLSHTSPSQARHPAKLLLSHTPLWHLSSLSLAPARLLPSHTLLLQPELPSLTPLWHPSSLLSHTLLLQTSSLSLSHPDPNSPTTHRLLLERHTPASLASRFFLNLQLYLRLHHNRTARSSRFLNLRLSLLFNCFAAEPLALTHIYPPRE